MEQNIVKLKFTIKCFFVFFTQYTKTLRKNESQIISFMKEANKRYRKKQIKLIKLIKCCWFLAILQLIKIKIAPLQKIRKIWSIFWINRFSTDSPLWNTQKMDWEENLKFKRKKFFFNLNKIERFLLYFQILIFEIQYVVISWIFISY